MNEANLDRISAKYGFSIVEISKNFKIDEIKQEISGILQKYSGYESLESLKNSLEDIKKEIKKLKEENLKEANVSSDLLYSFKTHYLCIFILDPLIEKITKILKDIEKIKNENYDPRRGKEMLESLEKYVKKQNFEFNAKDFEREINKALGILIEDGLFAYSVWLESEDKSTHRVVRVVSLLLLKDSSIELLSYSNDLREGISNEISLDIKKTLLARQLLERMLIYARYRAKALQTGSD